MASLFKRHGVGSIRKSRKVSLGTQELDYLTQNTELKDSTMLRSYFDNFIAKHPKGYIKKKDFENILQQCYPNTNVKNISKRIFYMYDKDRDGHITFRELMMVMYIMSNGTPEQNLRQIFRVFDDNNDGSIDMKEMKKFVKDITVLLSPSELETIQEEDGINVAFSEMDKNNDGRVSEDEFVTAILAKEKIGTMLTLKIVDILSPDNCC